MLTIIIQASVICLVAIVNPAIALIISLFLMIYYAKNRTEYGFWKTTGNVAKEVIYKRWTKSLVNEYSENGALESTTPYKNGWKHGVEKVYYPSGLLRAETPYSNSVINGTYREYSGDGTESASIIYENGKIVSQTSAD